MSIWRPSPLVLLLGLALMLDASRATAVPTLSFAPSNSMVQLGQSFTLDISVANAIDLFGFQFDLAFNPSVLSATSITEGAFLPSGGATFFIPGIINSSGGTITSTGDSLVGAIAGVSGSGTLARVSFQALSLGTSSIAISNVILLDSNLADITANIVNGSVTVTNVPEPAAITLFSAGLLALIGTTWRHRSMTRLSRSKSLHG